MLESATPAQSTFGARACPSCGATAIAPGVASQPPGESQPFERLTQSWYGYFKEKVFFSYDRCTACGMLYAPQYFTDEQLQ